MSVFVPNVFTIIGKTFIQWNLPPASGSYIIAKPMVKQFVCNNVFLWMVSVLTGSMLNPFMMNHSTCIFHGTTYKITGHYLRKFLPRIRHTCSLRKASKHIRGFTKNYFGMWMKLRLQIITHFYAIP